MSLFTKLFFGFEETAKSGKRFSLLSFVELVSLGLEERAFLNLTALGEYRSFKTHETYLANVMDKVLEKFVGEGVSTICIQEAPTNKRPREFLFFETHETFQAWLNNVFSWIEANFEAHLVILPQKVLLARTLFDTDEEREDKTKRRVGKKVSLALNSFFESRKKKWLAYSKSH